MWAPGATTGTTAAGGNGKGSAANQLDGPAGIALDGAGNLYVADAWPLTRYHTGANHRVQRFAPGSSTGVTVAGGNGAGAAQDQLDDPNDVALHDGHLYIADTLNDRVQWVL
jgi:hypothetical protein